MKRGVVFFLFSFLLAGCATEFVFSPAPVVDDARLAADIYVVRDRTALAMDGQGTYTYWVVSLDDANIARLEPGEYTKFKAEAGKYVRVGIKKWPQGWQKDEETIIVEPKKTYYFLATVSSNNVKLDVRRLDDEEVAGWIARSAYVHPER